MQTVKRGWRFESEDARAAPSTRRSFLHYLTAACLCDADCEAAALVFGELVSNVVRHAPGPIVIELHWNGSRPALTVEDHGAMFEPAAELPDPHSESGRGLFIVAAVASRPQVEPTNRGKRVTVSLPVSSAR